MYRKKTRFTALLLCFLLLALMSAPAAAVESKNAVSLEQAIRTVKQNFTIPAEYTEVTSGFNSYGTTHTWSLNWNDPAGKSGGFSAQVDGKTGEIISMHTWKPETQTVKIPAISLSEAQQTGAKLLKRLIPTRAASLQLIPDNQLIPLSNYGSLRYSMRWQRTADGIPVGSDGASIEIDLSSGKVLSYNLSWNDLKLPAPTKVIAPETACQSFIDNNMLKMQYIIPPGMRPLRERTQEPVLVYSISHPSNGVIDAFTGKPLVLDNRHWITGGAGSAERYADNAKQMSLPAPLTPEETKEISEMANLITRDEAVATVSKYLTIPAEMVLQSSNLDQDWQNPDNRLWNLNWNSSNTTSRTSLWARVNASTGELVGFSLYKPSEAKKEAAITREEARSIAENFLKKVQPQRFQQVKSKDADAAMDTNNPNWQFVYQRVVNGIPCPANMIEISIDKASKQPVSFYLNWSEKTFPSTRNSLSTQKANQVFLEGAPLTLTYTVVYGEEGAPREMRLVYQPQVPPGQPQSSIIDARTGAWLNYDGQPLSKEIRAVIFKDIAGHFGEQEISLLGQAGIFNEYGAEFHPDEQITLVSLLRAMISTREGIYSTKNLTDQQILDKAAELKWLKDPKAAPTAVVTRDVLAQLLVRYLDIEYLAQFTDMYQLPFQDAARLNVDLKGYAALTRGMGIIKGDGINFDPGHKVTRAEAAVSLVRTLKVK